MPRRPLSTLLVLLTIAAACSHHRGSGSPGGGGGGGGGGSQTPEAPRNLRLMTHPAGPPTYTLAWDATANVALDHFDIYAATTPLLAPDPGALLRQVDGSWRQATVQLPVDTGVRNFRLRAVGTNGRDGDLSPELAIDTAARVAFVGPGAAAPDLLALVPGGAAGAQNLSGLPAGRTVTEFGLAPDGRRAAFIADRDAPAVQELFVAAMAVTGSAVKVSGTLPLGGRVIPGARFAPDGNRVAFAADRDTVGVFELYVAAADGSQGPQKRSAPMVQGGGLSIAGAADIRWSPNGARLAYAADQRLHGAIELFVVPADGSGPPVPVSGDLVPTASLIQHAWSPDGRHVAFTADRNSDNVFELFVAPPDGSSGPAVRSGARIDTADVFNVAWSPDGTRAAFVSTRRSPTLLEIYIADAENGGEPVPLDASMPSFAGATRFLWSPDGSLIAFAADREVDGQFELYVAATTGGPANKVSGTMVLRGDVAEFAWAPDGNGLVFRADRIVDERYELFATAPAFAGEPLPLSGAMPADGDVLDFAWSTEGGRLCFRADLLVDQVFDVFVVSRDGVGGPVPIFGAGGNGTAPQPTWSQLGRR